MTREMDETLLRSVYTLNTWTDEKKAEARSLLEDGYWVRFGSTAIGHTRAMMVEQDGIKWAKEEYGDNLQVAYRKGYSELYVRLK